MALGTQKTRKCEQKVPCHSGAPGLNNCHLKDVGQTFKAPSLGLLNALTVGNALCVNLGSASLAVL